MDEKVLTRATLCFLRRKQEVLLAIKKRHIGAGLYNGYGGGIEGDELPQQSLARELAEECGIRVASHNLHPLAVADFHNTLQSGSQSTCRVHVYELWTWDGDPRETEEMEQPRWFYVCALPCYSMMPADRFWLPAALLSNTPVYVEAWYGPGQKELLKPVSLSVWGV